MHDDPEPNGLAEPALVLQTTPRNYRRRAVVAFIAAAALVTTSVVLLVRGGDNIVGLLDGAALVAYGVHCASLARRQVTTTALRIDAAGLHSGSGVFDRSWSGVVLVWVGGLSGLKLPWVASPAINLFTQAGLDFARRSGTRPAPVATIPVGAAFRVPTLCARLQPMTSAVVVDGTQISRRAAAGRLTATAAKT